jgi:hypothetical protein
MGGAMVGIANGWDAVYYNPSALGLSEKSSSVQVNYLAGQLMANKTDSLADGLMFKYGVNARFLRNRLGLGLIVGTSGTGLDLGSMLDLGSLMGGGGPPNWKWQRYADAMPLVLEVGFGFRIADWLAVGMSLNQKDSLVSMGYYPFSVDPILQSLIGISTGAIPSNVNTMNFSAGGDPTDNYATAFNLTFRPLEYVSLGYIYKPEAWSRFKLRVELIGGEGSILPESQYIVIDMKVPGQVETTIYGGAGHIPIPWNDGTLTIAYQREIQNWEGFYPQSTQFQWSSNDRFSQEWFASKLSRDPGLENVAFDRYGLEYEGDASPLLFWKLTNLSHARFAVRAGYYHWNSPQPDIRYGWQMAMLDSDADVWSFGLGFGFDRKNNPATIANPLYVSRMQLDLHMQFIALEDRDYRVREDEWGGVPLENYQVETKGNIMNIGFQITWIN